MTFDTDLIVKLGAVYGALQAVAQAVMLFAAKHTVVFKIAKFIMSGPQRPPTDPAAGTGAQGG